ncbi:quinone-dependent dihydroorotate dehydrogenase [Marivirga atlantica]|jgi:dihydroorotate dehydrogenase|uniref:Dihydroorotate dehydrogenase (quinone) n=1 Tax=Marivirga atlantica TaxID=1548457 RepID=A0A937DL62_9BACT|nr:quinone-dependent dihydroorotate dehydrogenase [Marivirga atlantica]MBL0766759.1 quinone-dependent dihydroorotate dehydrogenase [Marivirga atlantica]
MYKSLIRSLLFLLPAEKAHYITFKLAKFVFSIPGAKSINQGLFSLKNKKLERELFGIKFPNPVGLAAGFDKDAKMIDEFASLGFGFIEIGTLTPKSQPGNPQPRLFRLRQDEAIINRMGFNNEGLQPAIERLKNRKSKVIVGGNIGKNKVTPNEEAYKDYETSFEELFDYVDYFVVNVSSPNTPNLRALQDKEPLTNLLNGLMRLNKEKDTPKPILLKIAPDLTNEQLDDIIEIVRETKIDGIIATNTTIDRSGLKTDESTISDIGNGGLSGKPLKNRSTEVIRYLHDKSAGAFPIIGVGGIMSAQDAIEKLEAGASLIQLYTGFIYEGPSLIKKINKAILKRGL